MAKAPCQRPVLKDDSHRAGLPAIQLLFGLPKKLSVAREEKKSYLVYGGGSALALHEIPYQALAGALCF